MTMHQDILKIRDACRANLSSYTARAFSSLPGIARPRILDIGCGTGVPTMELASLSDGTILAVDSDGESCDVLREKIRNNGYEGRVTVLHGPVLSADLPKKNFDIVWAEGLLNVIGFEAGLSFAGELLRDKGFFVIHDEMAGREKKKGIIEKHHYALCDSFILDEDIWINGYYKCVEKKIGDYIKNHSLSGPGAIPFTDELRETMENRNNPGNTRSIFYILRKEERS